MEWYVLMLMLSLPTLSRANCSARCLKCAEQISQSNSPVNRLTCTLQCEGPLPSTGELDRCEKALKAISDDLKELNENTAVERNVEDEDGDEGDDDEEAPVPHLVKRYGGFIKRIDKNKNKIFWKENAIQKGLLAKKYGDALFKLVERSLPELTDDVEGEDVTSENDTGVYDQDAPLNEVKRYGGFRRKFGPKVRSSDADQSSQQELQKRYGGFMRRIRPKLKWDNQKRYGGFLRRHFKISVRSDEEPSLYDEFGF